MENDLTTEMHYEFFEDSGISKRDFFIYAVSGAIARGVPKWASEFSLICFFLS